ncbi:MAG: F0F1 ATP synthase subunit B [bacterium]
MEALGINLTWFLFQLGNFIVLLGGLTFLLHKPIMKLLASRQHEIKEGLENAEKVRLEMEIARRQQEELLEEARMESAALLKETREQSKKLEEELRKDAAAHSEELRKKAMQELASEQEQLRKELKGELAGMVIQATEKVLGHEVKSADKEQGVKKQIENL